MKSSSLYIILAIIVLLTLGFLLTRGDRFALPQGEAIPFVDTNEDTQQNEIDENDDRDSGEHTLVAEADRTGTEQTLSTAHEAQIFMSASSREIFVTDGVKHSIPIEEIRQGCFGRDCIPSVDAPVFIDVDEADDILPDDTIGIGLNYKGVKRFYPFNMLVTREIVNDVVAGDPLVITYCPLCGTGIVFEREFDGKVFEFGVSGMLWQSNLLMYNREANEADISLWSQVLGEAVLGDLTGTKLPHVPSDIVRYTDWRDKNPDTEVLNTGRIGDPYGGDYYRVARSFQPNFDEGDSVLPPTTVVSGIDVDGTFKAYQNDILPVGVTTDTVAGRLITIEKSDIGEVRMFIGQEKQPLPYIQGMWFSWIAAHPETELYKP